MLIPKQTLVRYRFEFQTSTTIYPEGVIDITFPAGYTPQDTCKSYYTNPIPASGEDVVCVKNGQKWEITGLGAGIPVGAVYIV